MYNLISVLLYKGIHYFGVQFFFSILPFNK